MYLIPKIIDGIKDETWTLRSRWRDDALKLEGEEWYAAPSVEELIEWMPKYMKHGELTINLSSLSVGYANSQEGFIESFHANHLIDALYGCAWWVLQERKV